MNKFTRRYPLLENITLHYAACIPNPSLPNPVRLSAPVETQPLTPHAPTPHKNFNHHPLRLRLE
ncbi:MAG: hypothetical protein NW224_04575 [Leptolyngbyaceae cyanobacterium bins.302]|nr:hypothetical protein [Leptolyngbyaceae cyanobacterium bins.302]